MKNNALYENDVSMNTSCLLLWHQMARFPPIRLFAAGYQPPFHRHLEVEKQDTHLRENEVFR